MPQHLVVVEVGLLHAAVLEGQLRCAARRPGRRRCRTPSAPRCRLGLTAMPQSIAQTTRCTRIAPFSDRHLRHLRDEAAEGLVHRDAACRGPSPAACPSRPSRPPGSARRDGADAPCSSARRYSTGSLPAACASSSTRLSMTKPVWLWPTERHHSTGMPVLRRMQVDAVVGDALEVGRIGDAFDRGGVDAVLDHHRLERVPAMIDWPTITCCQATGMPSASEADLRACARTRAGSSRRACRPRASTRSSPAPSRPWRPAPLRVTKSDVGVGAAAEAAAEERGVDLRPARA